MFWDAPEGYEPTPAERDLRDRLLPDPAAIEAAINALTAAELAANPCRNCGGPDGDHRDWCGTAPGKMYARPTRPTYAVVPLALPGKTRGLWTIGQEVVTIAAVWVSQEAELHAAEDAACEAARGWLNYHGRTGTTAYALIDRDGHAAVFEGFK